MATVPFVADTFFFLNGPEGTLLSHVSLGFVGLETRQNEVALGFTLNTAYFIN